MLEGVLSSEFEFLYYGAIINDFESGADLINVFNVELYDRFINYLNGKFDT